MDEYLVRSLIVGVQTMNEGKPVVGIMVMYEKDKSCVLALSELAARDLSHNLVRLGSEPMFNKEARKAISPERKAEFAKLQQEEGAVTVERHLAVDRMKIQVRKNTVVISFMSADHAPFAGIFDPYSILQLRQALEKAVMVANARGHFGYPIQ